MVLNIVICSVKGNGLSPVLVLSNIEGTRMNFIPFVSALTLVFYRSQSRKSLEERDFNNAEEREFFECFDHRVYTVGSSNDFIAVTAQQGVLFSEISGFEWATSIFLPSRVFFGCAAGFFTTSTALHLGHLNLEPSGESFESSTLRLTLHLGHITTTCLDLLGSHSLIVRRPARKPPT